MTLRHNNHCHLCTRSLLNIWRNQANDDFFVSNKVTTEDFDSSWPAVDEAFYDEKNHRRIAIEFKPIGNSRRDIATGLGQCLTYLNNYSAAYLIIPKKVDGLKEEYFQEIW